MIYVDPKQVDEVRGKVRPIVFTDILANGVSINKSSLKYNQNNLTFCFTDFAYGLPSALLYEYKLEGADSDWKLLTAQSEVSYYGLSSGTYTFCVRIPGNEQSMAIYKVTVQPMIPWWGWMLSILLIIGIVAFIRYFDYSDRCSGEILCAEICSIGHGSTRDLIRRRRGRRKDGGTTSCRRKI